MDRRQLGLEGRAALEQLAVVLDRVEADLAARGADVIEEAGLDRVPLGDEVPRRDEAVAALDLDDVPHPRRRRGTLDVVGEDRREAWPSGQSAISGSGATRSSLPQLGSRRSTSSGSIGQRGNSTRAWRFAYARRMAICRRRGRSGLSA